MSEILAKLPRVGRSFFRSFPNLRHVQVESMVPILQRKNLVLVSATGSGKTEAVVAPLAEKALDFSDTTYCLYICPTKALVNDIYSRIGFMFNSIRRDTGYNISVGMRTGDRDDTQRRECPNFLVTTPESLDVMISNKYELIRTVKAIVLDDMHELYGTPRGLHIKILLERLRKYCGQDFQRIAMSATIADPESISRWLFGQSPDYVLILDKTRKSMFFWVRNGRVADMPILIYNEMKTGYRKILVFTNTRKECDSICNELRSQPAFKDKTFLHYSSLDKKTREDTERALLLSSKAICVATSTLELGIDIGDIDLIVMYGPPHSVSSFLQRLGRGSRRTNQSKAVLIYRDTLELLKFAALIGLASDGVLENQRPTDFYSVIVQQIFSIVNGSKSYRVSSEKLFETLRCVDFLTENELQSILVALVDRQFLDYDHRGGLYSPSPKLRGMINHGRIYGNINSKNENLTIRDPSGIIGAIPPQPDLNIGDVMLFGGKFWKVEGSQTEGEILVKESPRVTDPKRIVWTGSGMPAGHEIAQRIREQLEDIPILPAQFDRSGQKKIEEIKLNVADTEDISQTIFHEARDEHIYYTFAGEFANKIAALLFQELQQNLRIDVDGISIHSSSALDFSSLPDKEGVMTHIQEIHAKFSPIMNPTIFYYLLPSQLRRKEVISFIGVEEISDIIVGLKTKKIRDVRLGIRD